MSKHTRRAFLRTTVIALGAMSLGAGCGDEDQGESYEDGSEFFPQSIASGDPRANSVILWTRAVDPDSTQSEFELELQFATDEEFSDLRSMAITARSEHDFCVKARVADLEPGTTYHYRFVLRREDAAYASRIGTTRTAPPEDADVPVRFAFVSCQDYNGRYFNNYWAIAELELDFIVHLGDYIYETTGNPHFQDQDDQRRSSFSAPEEAIVFNEGQEDEYHAAKSVSNYRDLYRTYRGDPALQAVHERTPMIITWDDHEFSDDCHGATATYHGGREDEEDVERRKAANRVWFEYMPVDYEDPEFVYDESASFPGDIRIYRDFVFGQHVHLVMTDLRTYRTDHPIPEDAFPGQVVVDEARLIEMTGAVPEIATPYVDIEQYQGGAYRDALVAVANEAEFDPDLLTGRINVDWINSILEDMEIADPLPIDEAAQETLERGVAFHDMGKSSSFGSFGSRSLVIKPAYDLYVRDAWLTSGGASEQVMGEAQEAWFLERMEGSTRTWKIWGNEFCLNQISVNIEELADDPFDKRYYLTVDLWDGQPNRRSLLLDRLADLDNVVAVTGDIHGFHAGTPLATDEQGEQLPERGIVEFVTSSISSATFEEELFKQIESSPTLSEFEDANYLVTLLDFILTDTGIASNRNLAYSDSRHHGFVVVECDAQELAATFHKLPQEQVREDYTERVTELDFSTESFRVIAGQGELQRKIDGVWRIWDPSAHGWV
jgi:alkaline phosphatase D